jgi:ribose 5-phosphate isomerase B
MKLGIAADHGGFELKEFLLDFLKKEKYEVEDFGCFSEESVDYPDFAHKLCQSLLSGNIERGILICGTGLGMSITANRYKGIRATLSNDLFSAIMGRRHNDSNVLVLGGRIVGKALAIEILEKWLQEEFEGGRHIRRLVKIDEGCI